MAIVELTLAHSGDPDDVFMWWPLTGRVMPDGTACAGRNGEPRIDAGRFRFRAVPGDISEFNRLAARPEADGGAVYDVTALSVRAWADVAGRYAITDVGGSFGDGYGPKVVCRADDDRIACHLCLRKSGLKIAVPGLRTSAFLTLGLMVGPDVARERGRFVEASFTGIIPMVLDRRVDAGLVIHEGQVMFGEAGLREVVDLGRWWKKERGLPLPLGVNAVKRDLDARHGDGTVRDVALLLERSLDYALAHREESIDATMPFAEANAHASGLPAPTRDTVSRYINMYVTDLTVGMGDRGRTAIEWLLREGAEAGLCPAVAEVDVVRGRVRHLG